jgi:O-succinylbenzoic acid--CoA ligase
VGGIALLTRGALLGSTLVLRGAFRPDIFLELAQEGRITHASLVPTMLQRILEAWGSRPAPPSLRCILMGGAASPRELVEEALALGFPLALTYGLTEASSQVATAPPRLVRRKPGTVGPPLSGVRLRLGKDGEILLKGPTVAPGRTGPDGWLHTGDLARSDDQGHLWIVGRLSERIISGGVNVDPLEVEEVLAAHDGVREVAVVGVPDPTWGERVVAAVVPLPEGSPSAAGLEALARANLSPAKRPREVRFLEALPRNTNGKVDRGRVRTILAGG